MPAPPRSFAQSTKVSSLDVVKLDDSPLRPCMCVRVFCQVEPEKLPSHDVGPNVALMKSAEELARIEAELEREKAKKNPAAFKTAKKEAEADKEAKRKSQMVRAPGSGCRLSVFVPLWKIGLSGCHKGVWWDQSHVRAGGVSSKGTCACRAEATCLSARQDVI